MHPRAPAALDVRYRVSADDPWIDARSKDLSASGMGLAVPSELTVGGTLKTLRLTLPAEEGDGEESLELGAQIIRCGSHNDEELPFVAGLQFLDVEPARQERLSRFVFRRLRDAVAAGEIEGPAQRIPFAKPIAIRFELFKDFVSEVSANLSTSGMFIRTSRPRPVGSVFDFRFEMGEDFTIIEGRGEVIWVRDKRRGPDHPSGMGVKFVHLDSASRNVIRRMVTDYIKSGFTPFDLEAELAPDLPLGDAEAPAEADEERAEPANLEEVEPRQPPTPLQPLQPLTGLGAEVDREARSDQLERELTSAVAERDQLGRRLRTTRDEKEALERELAAISAEVQQSQSGLHGRVSKLDQALAAAAKKEAELTMRVEELGQAATERDDLAARLAVLEAEAAELRRAAGQHAQIADELAAGDQSQTELTGRIEELEAENRELASERDRLAADAAALTGLEEEINNLKGSREATEGALASARSEVEQLKASLSGQDEQKEDVEARMQALSAERDELAARLDETRSQAEAAARQGETERAEIGSELAAARKDSQKLLTRIAELENRSTDTSTESLQLRSRLGHLEKENELQRREIAAEIAAREALAGKSEQALADVERMRLELDDLEREVERRREELENERGEHHGLLARSEGSEAEIGELRLLVGELEKFGLQRQQELDEQITQSLGIVSQTGAAQDEVERLRERVAELEERAETDRAELEADFERRRNEAESKVGELRGQVEDLEREAEERNASFEADLARQRETAESEASDLRLRVTALESEVEERRTEMEAALSRRDEDAAAESDKLGKEIADLERRNDELRTELEELGAKTLGAESEAERLGAQVTELDARAGDAEREADELRRQLGEVEQETARRESAAEARLAAETERSGELAAERDLVREEITGLGGRVAELEGLLESARGDQADIAEARSRAEAENRELRQRLDALEADEVARAGELDERTQQAESAAEQLRRDLERLEDEHHELGREAAAAADRAAASAARLGDLENELVAVRENEAHDSRAAPVVSPPSDEQASRRGVRPLQIAAGLVVGALALFGWQRVGLPLPGGNAGSAVGAEMRLGEAQPGSAPDANGATASVPLGDASSPPGSGPASPSAGTAAGPTNSMAPGGGLTAPPATDPGNAIGIEATPAGPSPPSTAAPDPAGLESAVGDWARAWSDQRIDDYLASYAPGFLPEDGLSRAVWQEQRRERVARPASLAITVGPMTREAVAPDRYRVTFSQIYASPTYEDEVVKTLEMVWVDGAWKIARETSQAP